MSDDQTAQHPLTEACFHCASDEEMSRGINRMDAGQPWDGRTIHWQVPESFCPHPLPPAQIVVFCDRCGDGFILSEGTAYARAHLVQNEGWSCDVRGDFCPTCKPEDARPAPAVGHPTTDPGDGRTLCEGCQRYVWPVIHSCPMPVLLLAERNTVAALTSEEGQ